MILFILIFLFIFPVFSQTIYYPDGKQIKLEKSIAEEGVYYSGVHRLIITGSIFWKGSIPVKELEKKYHIKLVEIYPVFGYYRFTVFSNPIETAEKIIVSGDGYAFADFKKKVFPKNYNDAYLEKMWHLENSGTIEMFGTDLNIQKGADIKFFDALDFIEKEKLAPKTWADVAIVDTGITEHPDFAQRIRNGYNNFSGENELDNGLVPESEYSSAGHGTGCAGIAAAGIDNETGVIGICPWCGIVPVRIVKAAGSYLSSEMVLNTFDFIMENENLAVVNCSYGSEAKGTTVPVLPGEIEAYRAFMKDARNGKGGAIVFAAGNSRENTSWFNLMKEESGLFIAGSSTAWDTKTAYSNFGWEMDIVAPSMSFYPAQVALTTTAIPGFGNFNSDYFEDFGGTSASAPVVSGAIAFLLSVYPELTLKEVEEILFKSADRIHSDTGWYDKTDTFGAKSLVFGYGRINLLKAVRLAAGLEMCENITEEICGNNMDDNCNSFVDEECFENIIGQNCKTDEDCQKPGYENGVCLNGFALIFPDEESKWEYPLGYCSVPCEKTACPGGSRCIRHDGTKYDRTGNDGAMCFRECNNDNPCPEGLICSENEDPEFSKCVPDPDWNPAVPDEDFIDEEMIDDSEEIDDADDNDSDNTKKTSDDKGCSLLTI